MSAKVPSTDSPPKTKIRPSKTAAAIPLRGVVNLVGRHVAPLIPPPHGVELPVDDGDPKGPPGGGHGRASFPGVWSGEIFIEGVDPGPEGPAAEPADDKKPLSRDNRSRMVNGLRQGSGCSPPPLPGMIDLDETPR